MVRTSSSDQPYASPRRCCRPSHHCGVSTFGPEIVLRRAPVRVVDHETAHRFGVGVDRSICVASAVSSAVLYTPLLVAL